jgi:hypothetical protein
MERNIRKIKAIVLFQSKMLLPALFISAVFSAIGMLTVEEYELKSAGFMFMVVLCAYHFLVYEIVHPEEFYLYYNVGLSKTSLWISTVFTGLFVSLITIML